MRIKIDELKCQGFGLCVEAAPHLIKLREEDGYAYALVQEVLPEHKAEARRAADQCPMRAIELID